MNNRIGIAAGLVRANLIHDYFDLCLIANVVERGESRNYILSELPELKRWPEALAFLQERL